MVFQFWYVSQTELRPETHYHVVHFLWDTSCKVTAKLR